MARSSDRHRRGSQFLFLTAIQRQRKLLKLLLISTTSRTMSPSSPSSSTDGYVMKSPRSATLQYPPSPPLSRHSNDSDDSLRALELSDGPNGFPTHPGSRARSYSLSGFDFQHDLLPLSASVSNPDGIISESGGKDIGLVNGVFPLVSYRLATYSCNRNCPYYRPSGKVFVISVKNSYY